jgi:hypothetical protein
MFTPDETRKSKVSNASLIVEAINKRDWQREFLKRLIADRIVVEERRGSEVFYRLGDNVTELARIVSGIEDTGGDVFDNNLRLSKRLWPKEVVLVADDDDDIVVEPSDDTSTEEPKSSEDEEAATGDTTEPPILEALNDTSAKRLLSRIVNLLGEIAPALDKTLMHTADDTNKKFASLNEGIQSMRKRMSDLESSIGTVNSSLNGLVRVLKEQSSDDVKEIVELSVNNARDEIIRQTKLPLSATLDAAIQAKLNTIQLLEKQSKNDKSKVAELAVSMRAAIKDLNDASSMFLDVMSDVEEEKVSGSS